MKAVKSRGSPPSLGWISTELRRASRSAGGSPSTERSRTKRINATAIAPGNDRQREERPIVLRIEPQEQRRQRRPDHGADVIHAAVEPVHLPSRRRRRPRGEHRVARRAAHAFAHSIEHADEEHLRPGGGDRDERARDRRHAVAEQHERPLPRASGPPSGRTRSFRMLLTASAAPSMMPSDTAPAPSTRVRKNGRSG